MELQPGLSYQDNDPWPVVLECGHKIAHSTPSHLLFIYLEKRLSSPSLSSCITLSLPVQTHSLSSNKSVSASLSGFSPPHSPHLSKAPCPPPPLFSPHNPLWDDSWSSPPLFNFNWHWNTKAPYARLSICNMWVCVCESGNGQQLHTSVKQHSCCHLYCCHITQTL